MYIRKTRPEARSYSPRDERRRSPHLQHHRLAEPAQTLDGLRVPLKGSYEGSKGVSTYPFLVGNGGMDSYSSPYIIPTSSPHKPFPHSLLRTRQTLVRTVPVGCRAQGFKFWSLGSN